MIKKQVFLLIILIEIGKTSLEIINDQTRVSDVNTWDSAFQTYGAVSKLCPLGTRYYMYPDIQQPIRYFLARGEITETNQLLFLIFIEISYQEKSVKAQMLFNADDNWHQFEQYFDIFSYEGKWFQHLIYYDNEENIIRMQMRWGENSLQQYFFPYIKFINVQFKFTIGGVYNFDHPISNLELILTTFPGTLSRIVSSFQTDLSTSWQFYFETLCSNVNTVYLGILDLIPSNKYQIFIDTKNLLYYKITFWVKIDIMNLDVDHEITIIRISANRFTSNFQQTGSNSVVIKYIYASKSQTWIVNIIYYSYAVPVIMAFEKNQDPYMREDSLKLDQEFLSSWHYISIEYNEKNEIHISFQNLQERKYIQQVYTQVFQFSNIYYRLLFGGASLDQNTLPMSLALISYYDCNQLEIKCHQSCQTCFGPMANQCLSCPIQSNRVFQAKENSCKCQIWYFENANFECVYSQYDNIIINMENQDLEDFDEFCNFGQFSYGQTCFQWQNIHQIKSPSAKQKKSVICSECLMRPTDWIVKNASCQDTYHLYNNSLNNNYVKRSSNIKYENIYFVLQNEQLIHCEGCKICFDQNQIYCFKSKIYHHLGQETYIQCLEGYVQNNEKCILEFNIKQDSLSQCQKGCQQCQNNICLACNNKENLFMDLKGQCQKCSIIYCKYCFEFNYLNLQENSLYTISTQNISPDDFVIGCALCVSGYYYSFNFQQCIKNSNPINLLFYLNEENEQKIYQSYFQQKSNQFQEIVECQQVIHHCYTCVYNNLGLVLCTKCEIGYFSNPINGLCSSCIEEFDENVLECQSENDYLNYNVSLLGFSQYFTQQYFQNIGYFNSYQVSNKIVILNCQNSKQVDQIRNQCVNGCTGCQDCQYIFNQYQCVKCMTNINDINKQYQQTQGICYTCPYPCSFCLQIDEDYIFKYNPYFQITSESISQTRKCLINYDDQTYIDQQSGLIKPYNKTKEKKLFFSNLGQVPIQKISDGNYLLLKSIQEYSYIYFPSNIELELLNYFYPLKKTKVYVQNMEFEDLGIIPINNVTDFIMENLIYDKNDLTFQIKSLFGVKVLIQNMTIKNWIPHNFLNIEDNLKLVIQQLTISSLNLLNFNFIAIMNFKEKYFLNLEDITFIDCYFNNSQFLTLNQSNQPTIHIKNLTFIRCKFYNSQFIKFDSDEKNQIYNVRNILFQNCSIQDSILFQILQTFNKVLLELITLYDVLLKNSTLFQINSETQCFNLLFKNLELHQSIIFSYSFGEVSNNFYAQDFTINNLTYNQSNIFYFQPLQQTCILQVQIENSKLVNVNQVYPLNSGSNSYLFFIQNSNVTIKTLTLNANLVISLFEILESSKIQLENILISSYSETLIDKYLEYYGAFQNQFVLISNFDLLTLSNIRIEQIYQLVDPFMSIRSDDSKKKNITINNFSLIHYISFNQVKSLNSAIYIQVQSQSDILIQNCNFTNNFISYKFPNSDLFFSALMKIKSPSSNILINNITFQNIQINNSSDTIIIIEANKILIQDIQVQNINNNEINLVKSMNGFGLFLCQFLKIQNSIFQNIDSILFGILYVMLNLDGEVHLINCIFEQQQREFVQILPQIGGVITVNGLQSHNLNLKISNVSVKLIITSQAFAFVNFLPSIETNYIYMNQLKFEDVKSYDNSLFKFDFPSNMKKNQVILKNIFFNNSFQQSLTISTNQNFIFNSSSLVGMIKVSFCKLFIQNFHYFGIIEQPLFNINDLQRIIITNIRISNSNLYNNLNHIIFISGTIQNNTIISNIVVSNLQIFSSLQSFINIKISSTCSEIQIKNFFFQNINCVGCETGILSVKLQNQRISLRNINIINSNCGINSCLQFFQSKVIILSSKFIKLDIEKNGILQFNNCFVSIKKSFIMHSNSFGVAGAIYINNSSLTVYKLALVNNSALIGAGIYYELQKTNEDNIKQILFLENFGKIGLSNIKEQPDFLQLKIYNVSIKTIHSKTDTIKYDTPEYFINSKQQVIKEQYLKVKSGQAVGEFEIFNKIQMQYMKNNMSLQLEEFNQLGEKVIDSFQKKCSVCQNKIRFSNNFNLQTIINEQNREKTDIITFNTSTNSYQLDSIKFYLNPYLEELYQLLVIVYCETLDINYYFTFYIRTHECEIGEYFSIGDLNPECKICDFEKGYFSVEKNSTECQRQDPNKIKNITYGSIELYEGFWRYSYNSHFIEECDVQQLCLGGWNVQDDSCLNGYLGAICKECDLYNIRGNSSYIRTFNGFCEKKEISQTRTIILTVTLMFITYFIAFIIARQKELMNRYYKIFKCYSLHYKILYKCNLDQLNTKIKLFIYLSQILYTLPTKRNNIDMTILFWPIGNSNKSLLQVINFLVDEFSLSIIYVKAIWAIIIPIFHVSIIWFIGSYFVKIFDRKQIIHFLQTGTIFFILYSLPCVVEEHSYLIQVRTLSNMNWIGANISYLYDTQVHKKWIIYFILPSLIFCSFIIPLLTFISLFISKKQQVKNITQGLISYFSSDYKEKLYFQEIINHLVVTLTILINSLFNESMVVFKTLLILIIALMYYVEISIYQPYFNKNLNKTQKLCFFLICLFIVLSCLSSTYNYDLIDNYAQISNYINFVILLLIIAINFKNILDTIIRLNIYKIDKIVKFITLLFPYLQKKYPKLLKSKVETKQNVKQRFKYLRTQFRVLRQHNPRIFKFNYNQTTEETHQVIYNTAVKSEQRLLIQTFPPIQQSIIL